MASAKMPLTGCRRASGVRPTITDSGEPVLEVFIFDFDEAIYGRRVVVEFLHKLRDEERLPDLDTLARPHSRRRGRRPCVLRTATRRPSSRRVDCHSDELIACPTTRKPITRRR
mgnify:CR=1 FL=1